MLIRKHYLNLPMQGTHGKIAMSLHFPMLKLLTLHVMYVHLIYKRIYACSNLDKIVNETYEAFFSKKHLSITILMSLSIKNMSLIIQ